MNGMKRTMRSTGKVFLALLGGILFPILIWVALGVALNEKLRAGRSRKSAAPSLTEILTAAGAVQRGGSK